MHLSHNLDTRYLDVSGLYQFCWKFEKLLTVYRVKHDGVAQSWTTTVIYFKNEKRLVEIWRGCDHWRKDVFRSFIY